MTKVAVQFGAGGIGRGFTAQLFHESSYEVVFVDVNLPVVAALNARRGYAISIVGDNPETIPITDVRAILGTDIEAVAEAVASADIVCTAVGANALPYIAPAMAEGLRRRTEPLNIILCENLHDAADVMRKAVEGHLPEEERDSVLSRTGFVQAVVARMVPVPTEADKAVDVLAVRVEAYKRLPIDAKAIVGAWSPIENVEPVENFEAWVERKLYVHNCLHAVLGYAGVRAGYEYGWQALEDTGIFALLCNISAEIEVALTAKHQLDTRELRDHTDDLMCRFKNKELGDTCRRLARDPIRKLALDDRLIGTMRLCQEYSEVPFELIAVISHAINYTDPDDPSAEKLRMMREEHGIDHVLREVCHIDPAEPLGMQIKQCMESEPQ